MQILHAARAKTNEFKRRFSYFLATFRATTGSVSQQIVTTNIKNSGLLEEFKMATKKTAHRDENKGELGRLW